MNKKQEELLRKIRWHEECIKKLKFKYNKTGKPRLDFQIDTDPMCWD